MKLKTLIGISGLLVAMSAEGREAAIPRNDIQIEMASREAALPEVGVRTSLPGKRETKRFNFRCIVTSSGQVIPNCAFSVAWKGVAKSGGHDHTNDGRPIGSFAPKTGNSGSDYFWTTFTSPEASGAVDVTLTAKPPGYSTITASFRLRIEIPGLRPLAKGSSYLLVGKTPSHASNHFGTAGFNAKLIRLANLYAGEFPKSTLGYNDMSLQLGGLFDFKATWKPPHKEHRTGINVDLPLRYFPAARRARVEQLAKSVGTKVFKEDAVHWHLTNGN